MTIFSFVTTTIKGLHHLRGKFVKADQDIHSLISDLYTIKAALAIIKDWAENDLVVLPSQTELVGDLTTAIYSCREAMGFLAEDVTNMVGDLGAEDVGFRARTRYVWNESTMKKHQDRLQIQVALLQFLVVSIHWLVQKYLFVSILRH
ncbi:MAG: hypothetical protein M1813_000842 [Trichoglossum hirsutum]|nr:MAG: hypothetical protein M1813_000842 [Trichoglossum hirsutum]